MQIGVVGLGKMGYNLALNLHRNFFQVVAYDINEARNNRLGTFLREHLPSHVVQSPHFPFKEKPRYLDLKGTQLEWSIGTVNSGWLYFWEAGSGKSGSIWEFAPSSATK